MSEPSQPQSVQVAVIGAGPAGLAVGSALRAAGLSPLVFDGAAAVGASWRGHYDRLHLHTHRRFSGLPGSPIPKAYGPWVARADVVSYLEAYAAQHQIPLALETAVHRLERLPGEARAWRLRTSRGELQAASVVVATGYNHTPWLPDWPGRDGFQGEVLHASSYRNPKPFAGRRVLVVGSGNTGAEIAVDLLEGGAAAVALSVRTAPNLLRRTLAGIPSQAIGIALRPLPLWLSDALAGAAQRLSIPDLSRHGLPRSTRGIYTQVDRDGQIPILDMGFIAAVQSGRLAIAGAVEGFDGRSVRLAGGAKLQPDAVIAATGYRRGLEDLLDGVEVLDARGLPRWHGATGSPEAPGLHFIGFSNPITGNLREIGRDARRIARVLSRAAAAGEGPAARQPQT